MHWLMRRVVDLVADEATREGFEILFGGEGVNAQRCQVEQAIEDLEILHNFNHAAKTLVFMAVAPLFCTSTTAVALISLLM